MAARIVPLPWIARALWLACAGAALGTVLGASSALAEIASHGYGELGFERTIAALVAARVRSHALEGCAVAGAAGLVLVAWASSPWASLGRAERGLAFLGDGRAPTWTLALAAIALVAVLTTGLFEHPELAALLAVGVTVAWRLARAGRRIAKAGVFRRATIVALVWTLPFACAAPFAVVPLRRLYPSLVPGDGWAALALLGASAAAVVGLRRVALVQLGAAGRVLPPLVARPPRIVVPLVAAVPLVLPAWSASVTPGVVARRPANVLILAIDTLRADHTTLAGDVSSGRDLTPRLHELGRRGVVFETAVSQASWTMPAMASIVTGKYPLDHGAFGHRTYLRDRELLISEVLREAGYATGSIVSNYYVDARHGFAQGVDEFDERWMPAVAPQPAHDVTNEALAFVERHADEPFYLLAHYMDPHYEYLDQADLDWAEGYDGWLADEHLDFDDMVKNRHLMERADLDHLIALYDEEIAHTDREIGRLLTGLAARPEVLANTLVIVVSDHGEEFMEHGQLFHTTSLHGELVRVPLIVVPPGGLAAPRRVASVVETRAIFATVLDVLGIGLTGDRGPSLLATAFPDDSGAPESWAFSLLWQPDREDAGHMVFNLASVRSDRWKVIWDQTRQRHDWYDLERDPGERWPLDEPTEDGAQRLLGVLDTFLAPRIEDAGEAPMLEPDADLRATLEELGYL